MSEIPDLGRVRFKGGANGSGSRRRWEGVALEMRRILRVRRMRSCEEGRAEREHEHSLECEESHLIAEERSQDT